MDDSEAKALSSFIQRMIMNLKVVCQNSSRDCKWVGLFKDFLDNSHLPECSYQDTPCPHCSKSLERRLLDKHLKDECVNRLVPCEFFENKVPFHHLSLINTFVQVQKQLQKDYEGQLKKLNDALAEEQTIRVATVEKFDKKIQEYQSLYRECEKKLVEVTAKYESEKFAREKDRVQAEERYKIEEANKKKADELRRQKEQQEMELKKQFQVVYCTVCKRSEAYSKMVTSQCLYHPSWATFGLGKWPGKPGQKAWMCCGADEEIAKGCKVAQKHVI